MLWKEGMNLLVQTFRIEVESQLFWIPETWSGDLRSSGLASGEKEVWWQVVKAIPCAMKMRSHLQTIGQRHLPASPLCCCCRYLACIGYLNLISLKLIGQFTPHRAVASRFLRIHKTFLSAIFNAPFEGFYKIWNWTEMHPQQALWNLIFQVLFT